MDWGKDVYNGHLVSIEDIPTVDKQQAVTLRPRVMSRFFY